MFRLALIVTAACAAMIAAPVTAHEYKAGALTIGHPWARATPKGASIGAGYFTVTNTGKTSDRLVGGSTDVASRFEVHEMTMTNGIMKMRPLANGLEIKPGQTVKLQPGGYHVMFVKLKQPLVKGQHIDATLSFAKAGKVKIDFVVEGIGAMHGGDAKPGMSMPGMKKQHGN
jgi:copper(I)-binding protein